MSTCVYDLVKDTSSAKGTASPSVGKLIHCPLFYLVLSFLMGYQIKATNSRVIKDVPDRWIPINNVFQHSCVIAAAACRSWHNLRTLPYSCRSAPQHSRARFGFQFSKEKGNTFPII